METQTLKTLTIKDTTLAYTWSVTVSQTPYFIIHSAFTLLPPGDTRLVRQFKMYHALQDIAPRRWTPESMDADFEAALRRFDPLAAKSEVDRHARHSRSQQVIGKPTK